MDFFFDDDSENCSSEGGASPFRGLVSVGGSHGVTKASDIGQSIIGAGSIVLGLGIRIVGIGLLAWAGLAAAGWALNGVVGKNDVLDV